MRNYEITFIVDPVLSTEDIKSTAQTYVDNLQKEGCEIVYVDEMGLRTLAYDINKRSNGVYYSVEFTSPDGAFINPFELALRRDERILRFLTVALDKYGVQYNADKRAGKIGKAKRKKQDKLAKSEVAAHGVSRKKGDSPSLSGYASGDAESFKEEE
ncbi:30S ribosomal protein S6 [Neolewinella lacunae]|uniref:Small ribosomal subunit protein bS6 n=1 Tax=Neolewinella lacunae TaxID=1517758 RepID=A0A923T9F6_9BACT|nr:30S ribosomal protein S6 [Neolewinella lacunae]MBC6995516.1 30S ribosomal protein S6 [Neolewinella lacunae]MDN3635104.1 30S ribosomal protein S6 [Neolewinella lacunae]